MMFVLVFGHSRHVYRSFVYCLDQNQFLFGLNSSFVFYAVSCFVG